MSLKYLQGLHHFAGKPVPVLDQPLCAEIRPDVQSRSPPVKQQEERSGRDSPGTDVLWQFSQNENEKVLKNHVRK